MCMGGNGDASEKDKRTYKGFPHSFTVMVLLVFANK